MSYIDKYLIRPIIGIIPKKGVDITKANIAPNLFSLHNFATKNYTFRRSPGYLSCGVKYHKSRALVKY